MIVGVPKEIKNNEYRVAVTPAGAHQLAEAGHTVLVQAGAGRGSALQDGDYRSAGAELRETAAEVFNESDMVVKVKEPRPEEYEFLRGGLVLFTYLHLAADRDLTLELMRRGVTGIGYETVQTQDGSLPLLTPMSEVAGRMAVTEGAKFLGSPRGGKGILLSGVPGVRPGTVTVLGGGVAGANAARVACGLGARVNILDISLPRLRYLDDILPGVNTLMYTPLALRGLLPQTDLLICTVLIRGARAPRLVARDMLALMERGSVIVDVSIDQGGCCETSRPTSHSEPIYEVDGVIHYCVANMPGAVAHTSTFALTNATFPYVMKIANEGWAQACRNDPGLCPGVHTVGGALTEEAVAKGFGLPHTPLETVLP